MGSQIKGSRYKGLYVLLPLMDFNEKLMDFNGILIIFRVRSGFPRVEGVESEPWEARRGPRRAKQGPTRPKNWPKFIKQKTM